MGKDFVDPIPLTLEHDTTIHENPTSSENALDFRSQAVATINVLGAMLPLSMVMEADHACCLLTGAGLSLDQLMSSH